MALSLNGKPQVFAYASPGFRYGGVSAVLRVKRGYRVTLDLLRGAIYEPRGNREYTVLSGTIVGVDLRQQFTDELRFGYRQEYLKQCREAGECKS